METQPELQISADCEIRGSDKHGSGHYGAPRGNRTHNGVDIVCSGGTLIKCPADGVVTRCNGVVYSDPKKREWRYIEVQDRHKAKHRMFYVKQLGMELGIKVKFGEVIGVAQGIEYLYDGITPHIHYEIKIGRATYIDPIEYLETLSRER